MNDEKRKNAESKTDSKIQEALDYIKELFERAGLPCEMREIPLEGIKEAKAAKRPDQVIVELVVFDEPDD